MILQRLPVLGALLALGSLAVPAQADEISLGKVVNLTGRTFRLTAEGQGIRFLGSDGKVHEDPRGVEIAARANLSVVATRPWVAAGHGFSLACQVNQAETLEVRLGTWHNPAIKMPALRLATWDHRAAGAGAARLAELSYRMQGSVLYLQEKGEPGWKPVAAAGTETKADGAGAAAKDAKPAGTVAPAKAAVAAAHAKAAGAAAPARIPAPAGAVETKSQEVSRIPGGVAGKDPARATPAGTGTKAAGAGAGAGAAFHLSAAADARTLAIQARDVESLRAAVAWWREQAPREPIRLVFGARASEAARFDADRWIYVDHQPHGDEAAPQFYGDFNLAEHLRTLAEAVAGEVDEVHFDFSVAKYLDWNRDHLAQVRAMLRPDGMLFLPLDGLEVKLDARDGTAPAGTGVADFLALCRLPEAGMPTKAHIGRGIAAFSDEVRMAARRRMISDRLVPALRDYLLGTFGKVEPVQALPVFLLDHPVVKGRPWACFACSGTAAR